MNERDLSYGAWQARRRRGDERLARLNAGLPPYRRRRLRGQVEADALRRAGTPDALIGPVGSDEAVEREREELIAFARRLRAIAGRDQAGVAAAVRMARGYRAGARVVRRAILERALSRRPGRAHDAVRTFAGTAPVLPGARGSLSRAWIRGLRSAVPARAGLLDT